MTHAQVLPFPARPDPDLVAKVAAQSTARAAHHEAGHAVAAVARGSELISISLGHVDWSTTDPSGDVNGQTHTRSMLSNQPFATFAGPWADARWVIDQDPHDDDDFDAALMMAWYDNADGDGAKYEERVEMLVALGDQIGLPVTGRPWEGAWEDELDALWPAICAVAAMLVDGQAVTHEDVVAAIEASRR